MTEQLLPHLSSEMPTLVGGLPWLVVIDGLLFSAALLAVIFLVYSEVHLTRESARDLSSRALPSTLRGCTRVLSLLRSAIIGLAVVVAVWWALRTNISAVSPGFHELVFGVIFGLMLLPVYVVTRLLQLGMTRFADRIDALGHA